MASVVQGQPGEKTEQSPPRSSLASLSRIQLALLVLTYILCIHVLGLYYFSRGFLLTRLSLEQVSPSYNGTNPAPLEPTHSKAIILIIDALRSDFLLPHSAEEPFVNQYYHNVLTYPAELSSLQPRNSLIFNSYADPPTTTVTRIKGLTTGSLPTFIDAGSNFASTAILEDNIISQLKQAGKRFAFTGDDTWVSMFPDSFEPDLSSPFESFNVEDLHSVDQGVINTIFPLMHPDNSSRWDVMIGHFLGVDHVGHRVGPSTSTMREKLKQMDRVLRDVVEQMDDDTLLIVLGDHGMDDRGDHGGEGIKETAAGVWFYSKGEALTSGEEDASSFISTLGKATIPETVAGARTVNQVDIVPTLSLLLGSPIPFNNMGSIIPELFLEHEALQPFDRLETAMRENAKQIKTYIDAYKGQIHRHDLAKSWSAAEAAAAEISGIESVDEVTNEATRPTGLTDFLFGKRSDGSASSRSSLMIEDNSELLLSSFQAHQAFAAHTLSHVRALWAQFSLPDMIIGLVILGLSLPTVWAIYLGVKNTRMGWAAFAVEALEIAGAVGAGVGSVIGTLRGVYTRQPASALIWSLTSAAIVSEVAIILPLIPTMARTAYAAFFSRRSLPIFLGPSLMILHAVSLASNSFILWEDHVVGFLAITLALAPLVKAMTAPMHRLRLRIIGFSLGVAILIRLVGLSTVCREEQQPYCRVTFFAGQTIAVAPDLVRYTVLPVAWYLPKAIELLLAQSKSNSGPASLFLQGLRGALMAGASYWLLEFSETWDGLNSDRIPLVKQTKIWLARSTMGFILGAGASLWYIIPLCIEVKRQIVPDEADMLLNSDNPQESAKPQVTVLGFANSYGSTYLFFLLIGFSLFFLVNQSSGQVAIAFILLVLLGHLELSDTQRDSQSLKKVFQATATPADFDPSSLPQEQPTFTEIVPLALLGHIGFFATGHQAVLATIQWKAAFVGFSEVVYPISPLLVVLNTWGPFIFTAIATPLIALWNVSPIPNGAAPVLADALQSCLGFILYYATLAVSAAASAAWLRRHLMVWKVFAPRFMLAGTTLILIDLAMLLAIGVGVARTTKKMERTFKAVTM